MSKLLWDQVSEKKYETGVEKGVLYPAGTGDAAGTYPAGVAWTGLTAVNESPSGAEPTPLYADNKKYLNLMSAEDFGATIEAYTYPDEFAACDGSVEIADGVFAGQQPRTTFGLCYKTLIGNDTAGTAYGYKLHLVYGALAKPSAKNNATVNESPEAATMSWEISTTPVEISGHSPSAHFVIDSTKTTAEKLASIEAILYGTDATGTSGQEGYVAETTARLPLPSEIITLMGTVA